jgi:hypothetical protein
MEDGSELPHTSCSLFLVSPALSSVNLLRMHTAKASRFTSLSRRPCQRTRPSAPEAYIVKEPRIKAHMQHDT